MQLKNKLSRGMSVEFVPVRGGASIWKPDSSLATMRLSYPESEKLIRQTLTCELTSQMIEEQFQVVDTGGVAICDSKCLFETLGAKDEPLLNVSDRLRVWKDLGIDNVMIIFKNGS